MSSRTNPTSRGSRGSSPRLAFDVRPCRRAQLLWALFGLSATVALAFSLTPHPAWRVTAAAAALALASLPSLALLMGRGARAIRRFEWAADGQWHLTRADGRTEIGRLAPATATLGPWILLAWTVGARRWSPLSQRYALIEEGQVNYAAFRALRGRLSMLGGRDSRHAGAVAP